MRLFSNLDKMAEKKIADERKRVTKRRMVKSIVDISFTFQDEKLAFNILFLDDSDLMLDEDSYPGQ